MLKEFYVFYQINIMSFKESGLFDCSVKFIIYNCYKCVAKDVNLDSVSRTVKIDHWYWKYPDYYYFDIEP
jgi:hypothetical protein